VSGLVSFPSNGDTASGSPAIQEAAAAIAAAGGDVALHDYPGSEHAFVNDTRPEAHHPQHAATAWQRTVQFLREHVSA